MAVLSGIHSSVISDWLLGGSVDDDRDLIADENRSIIWVVFLVIVALVGVTCLYMSYRARHGGVPVSSSSRLFFGRRRRRHQFGQKGFEREIQKHSTRIRKAAVAASSTAQASPLLPSQSKITCPLPGTFEVELREYGVTDKKSGDTLGGNITRSKLHLTFIEEEYYGAASNGTCGWKIRGSRRNHIGNIGTDGLPIIEKSTKSTSGSFLAIEQGFLSPTGEAYWVERGSASQPSVLAVVQFTSMNSGSEGGTGGCEGFVGEFLSSENTNGRYVDCMEEHRRQQNETKHDGSSHQCSNQQAFMEFEDMSFASMVQGILDEFIKILLCKRRRQSHGKQLFNEDNVQIIV